MSRPDRRPMKKNEYERELRRRKRVRMRRLMRIHMVIFCVMVIAFAVVCFHIFSRKKEIRNEAVSLYQAGNYEEALERFQDAYEEKQWFSDAINVDILMYEADCMLRMEMFSEAEELYRTIAEEYSGGDYDVSQLSYLTDISHALANYKSGDYVSTAAAFTKAVEAGHPDMSIYAAICYEHQKSYDKMKEYLDIYAGYHGTDTYVNYKYASYYYDTEDYAQALEFLTQAFSSADTEYQQKILYAQIMCYKKMQNYTEAYNLAQTYVQSYPDDADGQELYAYLDTRVNIDEVPVNDKFNLFTGGTNSESHSAEDSTQ